MLEEISSFTQMEEVFLARPMGAFATLAIVIGILSLGAYLYRRSWGLSIKTRIFLLVVRVMALAMMVAILMEPTAVIKETQSRMRGLPVLLDVSASMSMKDQRKRPEDIMEAASALGKIGRAHV
jgi:hypothetical protein